MESLLIGVTVVSLGLAVTMSAVAWTLLRHERQRATARVEALEAMAFADGPSARVREIPPAARTEPTERATPAPEPKVATSQTEVTPPAQPWDLALGTRSVTDRSVALDDFRQGSLAFQSRPDEMFENTPAPGVVGRRWLAVAAVGLLVAAGIATFSAFRSPEIVAAVKASRTETSTGQGVQPLELLSLRHSTDVDGGFTVTGLVQNPPSGTELRKVEAIVYLFDNDDQYFTGGRAVLEVPAVQPGDESPFVVKVPNATGVSRYRVGFRHGDGRVVAHVDRRGQLPTGTTGDTLVTEPEIARPAGGMKPVDGVFAR